MTARRTAARDRNEAALEAMADKMLTETKFARLRTRRARMQLVWLQIVMLVATPVTWIVVGTLAGLGVVIASFVALFFLRRSVRVVADLPDQFLDERQLAGRNASYVEAYRVFGGFVMLLATVGLIAFIVNANDDDVWRVDLSWEWMMAILWTLEVAALAVPSMVIAVRDGGELPLDPDA